MKKAIASAGLLALGAAATQTALAQATGDAPKPWSLSGTLRGFYDDNINTSPNNAKESSVGYEIRPYADINVSSGPTIYSASFLYSYKYYEQRINGKADQSMDFELSLKHHFNERFSLTAQDSFVIAQEPDVLAAPVAGAGSASLVRSDGSNLRNMAALTLNAQLTQLFGVVLGYGNTYYDYQENQGNTETPGFPSRSALLDRVENSITLDTTWLIDPRTTGVLGYKFLAVNYLSSEPIESPVNPPPGPHVSSDTRNNFTHYFYAGADHTFRSDLVGSARVGVQYFDYYNEPPKSLADDLGPYVNLSMQYAYGDGGNATVGFTYSHNQTDQAASSVNPGAGVTMDQESAVVYASASQRLTFLSPRLTGTLSAQYQNSVFNGGPVAGDVDNFYLLGLNLSYQFTHLISGEVGYNYDLLASDIPDRGYSRNRVYLGVTAAY